MNNEIQSNKNINDYPEVLNAKNIAEYLNIGYVKALHLLKYGGVPCIRIGNTYRVSRPMFVEWLNQNGFRSIA